MTIVRPTHYTHNAARWRTFATTLGLTPAFEGDEAWMVFDGDGRVAVHGVLEGDPLHGTTELDLLVDDIDVAREALLAAGFEVMESVLMDVADAEDDVDDDTAADAAAAAADGAAGAGAGSDAGAGAGSAPAAGTAGDVENVLFLEVAGLPVSVASPGGVAHGDMTIQPIWYTDDLDTPRRLLTALGLTENAEATSGQWVEFRADGGGFVALHHGQEPQVELSLRYEGDLDALRKVLHDAGYDSRLTSGDGVRTVHVTTPDGWELWINGPLAQPADGTTH